MYEFLTIFPELYHFQLKTFRTDILKQDLWKKKKLSNKITAGYRTGAPNDWRSNLLKPNECPSTHLWQEKWLKGKVSTLLSEVEGPCYKYLHLTDVDIPMCPMWRHGVSPHHSSMNSISRSHLQWLTILNSSDIHISILNNKCTVQDKASKKKKKTEQN